MQLSLSYLNVSNPYPIIPNRIANLLKKYGSKAHLYMPGPGVPVLGPENITGTWASPGGVDNTTTGTGQSVSVVAGTTGSRCAVNLQGLIPNKTYRLFVRAAAQTAAVTCYLREGNTLGAGTIQATSPALGVGAVWDITFVATRSDYNLLAITASASSFTLVDVSCKELQSYSNKVSGFTAGNYLESTGQTHAVVDGAVGLVLDAAGSVGANISPSPFAGWSAGAGVTVNGSTFSGSAAGIGVTHSGLVIGKTYRYSVSGSITGTVSINTGDQAVPTARTLLKVGLGEGIFVADRTWFYLRCDTAGAGISDCTVSLTEVTGTHATQATTANKPTLRRGIVNLLTWSNDLTNAVWTKVASGITGSQADPFGGTSSQAITDTAADAAHYVQQTVSYIYGVTYSVARIVKAGTTSFVQIPFSSSAFGGQLYANFDLTNGVVGNKSASVSASIAPVGNGFYLCVASATATSTTSGNTFLWLLNSNGLGFAPAYLGTGAAAIYHYASGNFVGTLTAQQIIDAGGIPLTTTAPASSSIGKYWWEHGNSKYLTTAPLFQMSDDFCIIAGASINSATVESAIYAQSNGSNNALPEFMFNTSGQLGIYAVGGGATLSTYGGPNNVGAGPVVCTAVNKSSNCVVRRNGVQVTSTTFSGTYNTATTAALGAFPTLTPREFLAGGVYPTLVIQDTVDATDVIAFERWIGGLCGVKTA